MDDTAAGCFSVMGTKALLPTLQDYFQDTPAPVVCAQLFGSHARSDQGSDSDVDVAVVLQEACGSSLLGPITVLRGGLERLLGREVDAIDLRKAPVDLIHRVLRDGHLLMDREPSTRALFKVHARNAYFDLLPHLRRYRRGALA
ncbi:nucleotidyltransferase domain-containing protein [Aquisalimonas sp.]|uniref:type VII toxin-antitoxin system MntA family adenylyltransferase antitoxin n=1 Tax=Aquisalimonas sp. TaxID=1872621 RepID=UPI0025C68446|nr:nucleotidyltransferase domain-containing protein [Aquisalimonas sp.]